MRHRGYNMKSEELTEPQILCALSPVSAYIKILPPQNGTFSSPEYWHRIYSPTHFYLFSLLVCFPSGSAGKESACHAGDLGLNPGLGRSLGEGKGYPFQYFGLENSKGLLRVRHDWATFTSLHLVVYSFTTCVGLCIDYRS